MTVPKKIRNRGEGSISERPDGKWLGQVTLGRDANGRKIRRSVVADSKRACIDALHKLKSGKKSGSLPAASKLTVGAFLDSWLEQKATECARRTVATYRELCQRHVAQTALAGIRLQSVSPLHIQSWLAELERRGVGAPTRANARRVLRTAFQAALDLGLLSANPVARIKPPRLPEKRRPWFRDDEVQRLLAATATEPASVRAFAVLLLTTGMRFGEVAGLAWSAIDLDAGAVRVERALKELDGAHIIEGPKTAAGRRTLAIPPIAVEALRALRRGVTPIGSALVFTAENGKPLRRSNCLRRVWHPLLAKAGIKPMGFHAARRSHATQLVAAGADLRAISARIGHADVSFTVSTYAQVAGDADRRLAALTGQLLAREGA